MGGRGAMTENDTPDRQRERKQRERKRSKLHGWEYVSVRVPPKVGDEIKRLAYQRRQEFLDQDGNG
jgi:hypothetical protein